MKIRVNLFGQHLLELYTFSIRTVPLQHFKIGVPDKRAGFKYLSPSCNINQQFSH